MLSWDTGESWGINACGSSPSKWCWVGEGLVDKYLGSLHLLVEIILRLASHLLGVSKRSPVGSVYLPKWKWKCKSLSRVQLFVTPQTIQCMEFSRPQDWSDAFPFSRRSSQARDWTQVSRTAGGFFTSWPTREAQEYWSGYPFSSWSSWPRNRNRVSCIAGGFFTNWTIKEALPAQSGLKIHPLVGSFLSSYFISLTVFLRIIP